MKDFVFQLRTLLSYFFYLKSMCVLSIHACVQKTEVLYEVTGFVIFLEVHNVKDIMILPPHFQLCT